MSLKKYEIPAWLAIAWSILYPQEVWNVIWNVVWWVQAILWKTVSVISSVSPKLWAAAPFAMSLLAWLWGWKLAQIWLDKLWIENQLFRLTWIWSWAYLAASSVVAPYFAAWAWIYYWWKFSKWALSKIKNWASFLNPFKKIWTS